MYAIVLGGFILATILIVVLRSMRTKAVAHQTQAQQRDLQERIRSLPPPPVKAVKEPELKLPRRNPGEGSSRPWPTK